MEIHKWDVKRIPCATRVESSSISDIMTRARASLNSDWRIALNSSSVTFSGFTFSTNLPRALTNYSPVSITSTILEHIIRRGLVEMSCVFIGFVVRPFFFARPTVSSGKMVIVIYSPIYEVFLVLNNTRIHRAVGG